MMECTACFIYYFMIRLVVYLAVLAFLSIITVIALKCLGDWRDQMHPEEDEGETSPLMMPQCDINKILATTRSYGSCQKDIESANCCSSSNNNNDISYSKYCSELYDAKICIICYDEQRNCFFVPCGHCATCFACAQRIFQEENRNCPVCRRVIGKIRKMVNF